MDKRELEILKAIYGNKKYDIGGDLLKSIPSAIGPVIGTLGSGNRHTVLGDALIGISPLAGYAAGKLTNKLADHNTTNSPTTNVLLNLRIPSVTNTMKSTDYTERPIPEIPNEERWFKYTLPLLDSAPVKIGNDTYLYKPSYLIGNESLTLENINALGGSIASGIGSGVMASLGALTNRAFGNNKTAIANNYAKMGNAMANNAKINEINTTEDLAKASVDTNFGFSRSDYGWFRNGDYKRDLEMASANKAYAANIIPHAADRIDTLNNLALRAKYAAFGGNLGTAGADFSTGMMHVNNGDTHENNPYQGVLMGVDPQGTPNLVEEGETVYNDYVFSNRLKVPKQRLKKGQKKLTLEERILHKYEGKTYADAAKKAEKDNGVDERPNDNIAKRGFEHTLEILALSLELERAKEKDNEANNLIKEYVESLSPEDKEQLLASLKDRLMLQALGEIPEDVNPLELQVSPEEQQAMEQQLMGLLLLSPEQQAMMQQQALQMSPEEQLAMMLQQQMSPEQLAAMLQQMQLQAMQQLPLMNAYGGYLYEQGGQMDPQALQAMMQLAMLLSLQTPLENQLLSPELMAMMQQLLQGGEGEELYLDAQMEQEDPNTLNNDTVDQPLPSSSASPDLEEQPQEEDYIDTDVDVEDLSTKELNDKLKEIIDYAKNIGDRLLARDARRVKNKGSRVEKEDFVKDTLEEIKEDQQLLEALRQADLALAEQQALQYTEELLPQLEEETQDPMMQLPLGEAPLADAGQALDAQMLPQQEMLEPQMEQQLMMSYGGKLFGLGGAIDMNATLAAIFERNRNNPAMMAKFRRLLNSLDPLLQNDIAREIIELDRSNQHACGGKLYADGGDISSQVQQAKSAYQQIALLDPRITLLYDLIYKSITPEAASQIQLQYGISIEDYAILATMSNYSLAAQGNQQSLGGRINRFDYGGAKKEVLSVVDLLFRLWGISLIAIEKNPSLKYYRDTLADKITLYNDTLLKANPKYKLTIKDIRLNGITPDITNIYKSNYKTFIGDLAQQQYLQDRGFTKQNVLKGLLTWLYSSPWAVRDNVSPYKTLSLSSGNILYIDPDTGIVYNGVKNNYTNGTPFDIITHGSRYTGDYANLQNQGYYRDSGNYDNNPFLTQGTSFEQALKNYIDNYNKELFNFVASLRGEQNNKKGFTFTDKVGKIYYKDKKTKKKVYIDSNAAIPNNPRSSDWSKIYLTGLELRDWYLKLNSDSATEKQKYLAQLLRRTWGDKIADKNGTWHLKLEKDNGKEYGAWSESNPNGYITETPEYGSAIDPRTGKAFSTSTRTNDGVLGMDHITPFESGIVRTYFVKDKDNKYHQVVLNDDIDVNSYNPTKFGTDTNNNGWTVQKYLLNDDAKRYAIKVGDDVYTINDKDGAFDPSTVGLEVTQNAPYKDLLIAGLNGKTTWLTPGKSTKASLSSSLNFPFPSDWPYFTGMGIQGAATLYNILRKPDYSNANTLAEWSANVGKDVTKIGSPKIGDYMAYRPVDINMLSNKVTALGNQGNRLMSSLSGGNRGTAAANILANNYNTIGQIGSNYIQAFDSNRKQEKDVADFNRGTNILNANWTLDADKSNLAAANNFLLLKGQYIKDAMEMRNKIEEGKANAINAGLSGLLGNLAAFNLNRYLNALLKYRIDKGYSDPTIHYSGQNKDEYSQNAAKGGKLRKRKKRTFNL